MWFFGDDEKRATFSGDTVVHFSLKPQGSTRTLVEQFDAAVRRSGEPRGIVLWCSETDSLLMRAYFEVAKMVSAFLHTPVAGGRVFFITVTRMDGRLGASGAFNFRRAKHGALFGLCKTANLEWGDVFCRAIDLDPNMSFEQCLRLVELEMKCPNSSIAEVGWRLEGTALRRSTPTAEPSVAPGPKPMHIGLGPDDTFVVTGGAKGITALCVAEVARLIGGGFFYLLGRSAIVEEPAWCCGVLDEDVGRVAMAWLKARHSRGEGAKPTPRTHKALVRSILSSRDITSTLRCVELCGGQARYVTCDTTVAKDVDSVVKTILSRGQTVDCVIHGAGVLRDRLIEKKTVDDFDAVFDTKVQGLEIITLCLDRHGLLTGVKKLVAFSSLAGVYGNIGQSDYAMANEVLNKACRMVYNRIGISTLSLCFGPWDGGMVTPDLKRHFVESGIQIIPRDEGSAMVAKHIAMDSGAGCVQMLYGNWARQPARLPSRELVVRRVIALNRHAYLNDHRLKGVLVVPMTLATSLMLECVEGALPGHLLCVKDVSLFGGIQLEHDVEVEIRVQFSSLSEVRVRMLQLRGGSAVATPAYACVVCSTPETPSRPSLGSVSSTSSTALCPEETVPFTGYNGCVLFHGPSFQHIRAIAYQDNACVVDCVASPETRILPRSVARGVLLDTVFQQALVVVRKLTGEASLPTAMRDVVLCRHIPDVFCVSCEVSAVTAVSGSTDSASVTLNSRIYDEDGDIGRCVCVCVTSGGLDYT